MKSTYVLFVIFKSTYVDLDNVLSDMKLVVADVILKK